MAGDGKKKDDALLLPLAQGVPTSEAARRAGVSERTAYRRMEDPSFRRLVMETRASLFAQAVGVLASTSGKAAEVLGKLLDSESEQVRLNAARLILELGPKIQESTDLAEQIAEIKQRLEEDTDGNHPTA
jgi:hypothetical protein